MELDSWAIDYVLVNGGLLASLLPCILACFLCRALELNLSAGEGMRKFAGQVHTGGWWGDGLLVEWVGLCFLLAGGPDVTSEHSGGNLLVE